jgi:hypothetical protein
MQRVSVVGSGLAFLGLTLVLAGCGADDTGLGTDAPTSTVGEGQTTSSLEDEEMDLVNDAMVDLATHLGVAETDIELISMEAVTWSDGSLGCPEPGKSYTQALVDGHRIVLGYGERAYVYHSGGDRGPFLCPNPDSKDGGYDFVPPPGDDTR